LGAVAKTLRLKPIIANLGGFLRTLVETPTYHAYIAQIDEDTALRWLRDAECHQAPKRPIISEINVALSKDALVVQELKRDLERVMTQVPSGPALLRFIQLSIAVEISSKSADENSPDF
jgi:hypothetical protein